MLRPARLLIALLTMALLATPAMAASGTHAWSTAALILRDGPGLAYAATGDIATEQPIMVLRCQRLWCLVDGEGHRGWATKQSIVFGRTPTPWPGGINPDYPSGGPVCFYTGTNYSGAEFCVASGRVINDLALLGLDNDFGSIRIEGSASASVCRDRFFQSYCERIIASQPRLSTHLRNSLSAIRVH